MEKGKIKSVDELNQFNDISKITAETVRHYMDVVEKNLISIQKAKFANHTADNSYLERAQAMLTFARDNFNKGFFYTAHSCLKLAENYLDRCGD